MTKLLTFAYGVSPVRTQWVTDLFARSGHNDMGNDTDATSAREQLELFVDKGGTLVDTAASYVGGDSEKLLGQLLAKHISRREVVLVSKAGVRSWRTGERSAVSDAGRGTLLDTLDDSLARLGTDHLDLWLVQIPDYYTPMEETASALEMAVRSGRTRYVGGV